MLVTKRNFDSALKILTQEAKIQKALGFDSETTCLHFWDSPWYGDLKPRVFSMQFATQKEEFYFDFNHDSDRLTDAHFGIIHRELTDNPEILWFIANAPFDLQHCANHDVLFRGTVHCTKAIARVVDNTEPSLKLDDLGVKYLGVGKDDVITLLKERGHVTKVKKFGYNDKIEEVLHFDRLELGELVSYGKKDTRLCYDLGVWQIKKVLEIDKNIEQSAGRCLYNVLLNEQKLTPILFEMAREGVLIDRRYTEEAYEHEVAEYRRIESELDRLSKVYLPETKIDWLSAAQLKPLFGAMGEPFKYTTKGNACFDKEALEDSDSEIAKLIVKYRYHNKRAHTYFENYLWLADRNDVLHAEPQQSGTGFARMSYWNPNLQNVPKRRDKEESNYKVRKCFIPKPGTILADFDYKGAEYYMAVDYARETPVIEQMERGENPHKILAAAMGIPDYDSAKTMQYRILYGAGYAAVGRSLGHKGADAQRIGKQRKLEYFRRMPGVAKLIEKVKDTADQRGYIFNWLGRILHYTRDTSYASINGLLQSGVGDMTKVAMVNIREILKGKKSKMLIQVHDSLVMKIHPDELDLVPLIKKTMIDAYPHKVLKMGSDAGFSVKSWAELTDEIPTVP